MNSLQQRLVQFSLNVYEQLQSFKNDPLLGPVSIQLMRSATSTGANYSEAQSASSYRDFHNKVRIALKEMQETQYWICFLKNANINTREMQTLFQESEEIIRILSTISKKTDPVRKPDP